MNQPNISWHIKEGSDSIQENEYYLGSYSSTEDIELNIQVWNNKYGQTEVESIDNARLSIFFDAYEDNSLLNYCKVSIDDSAASSLNIEANKGTISIGELAGYANNGAESDRNKNNFKNIQVVFSGMPHNLKKGLKNMFLDIEFD